MVKIFLPGKIIWLIHEQTQFIPGENHIMAGVSTEEEMRLAYRELVARNELKEIFFFNKDKERLFALFTSMFRVIPAAGGLVKSPEGAYLFIFRHGKWDLPKGKVEKGEDLKKAAIREVEEECGIRGLINVQELLTTYHVYSLEERQVLKPTVWFSMEAERKSKLTPQTEEGITAVKWIMPEEFGMVKANTFPSILEVITAV